VVRTGDIGAFKIVSEGGVAAGVRRIEAVTGLTALDLFQSREELVRTTAAALRAPVEEVPARVAALQEEVKKLRKELEKSARSTAGNALDAILAAEEKVGPLRWYGLQVEAGGEQLLALADQVKQKALGGAVFVLIGREGEKAPIVVACDKEALALGVKAGDLCKVVAGELGGGGGGNPSLGRGQGRSDRPVDAALKKARATVAALVGA
jgi:alanyl-tRNA synthetase